MDFLSNAWDSFTGLFSGDSGNAQTMSDLDIDGDGSIGSTAISDYPSTGYAPDLSYGADNVYNTGFSDITNPNPAIDGPASSGNSKGPWYTNPNVLSAGITAGAGLFGGMSQLNVQKQQLKASAEEKKMNNLLELAKLKNQILMKGSSGSGSGRGGGAGKAEAVDRQYSTNKINQLNNLGSNLGSIYKG
jgi:hypothetical protein